jgi:hypothetical protein
MFNIEEININNMIVHILDSSLSLPVISKEEIEGKYDVKEFFANHIVKTLNDDSAKACKFDAAYNQTYEIIKGFKKNNGEFIEMSINVANKLFSIMRTNVTIPSADLAVIHYSCRGVKYLALLKLNYGKSYIHHREQETNNNSIIQHRTTLPNMGQKINEVAIVNLETMDIQLLEKKYEIDGNKEYYLSQYLLKCSTELSSKEQYGVIKNVSDRINKKYFSEDVERQIEVKQAIFESVEESGEIATENFAERIYGNNLEIKKEFMEAVSKKGIEKPTIKLTEKTITRSLEHHKIKTDLGIEIKAPTKAWGNIEIIVEPDGKQTIIIKNNNKIMSR